MMSVIRGTRGGILKGVADEWIRMKFKSTHSQGILTLSGCTRGIGELVFNEII